MWKQKSNDMNWFTSYELNHLREFLEGHPAYRAVYAQEGKNIEAIFLARQLTIEELIDNTRNELLNSKKKLLA
jgi:hypothetical protein